MRIGTSARALVGVALLLGVPASALAAPITFTFTGTVTHVDARLQGSFSTADTMSGFVTFDSALTDSRPLTSMFGRYGGLSALEVTISGAAPIATYTARLDATCGTVACSYVEVFNDPSGIDEEYEVLARQMSGAGVGVLDVFGVPVDLFPAMFELLLIADKVGGNYSDDALPLVPPDLQLFEFYREWFLDFEADRTGGSLRGSVTSLALGTTAPPSAPEPATVALLGSGLLALLVRKRRYVPAGRR